LHLTVLNSTKIQVKSSSFVHQLVRQLTVVDYKTVDVFSPAVPNVSGFVVAFRQVEWMTAAPFVDFVPQASKHALRLTIVFHPKIWRNDAFALWKRQAKNLIRATGMNRLNIDESFCRKRQVSRRRRFNSKIVRVMNQHDKSFRVNSTRLSVTRLRSSSPNNAQSTVHSEAVHSEKLFKILRFWVVIERAASS
jgi:hypothetical protein